MGEKQMPHRGPKTSRNGAMSILVWLTPAEHAELTRRADLNRRSRTSQAAVYIADALVLAKAEEGA